jgi:hypothetical protein
MAAIGLPAADLPLDRSKCHPVFRGCYKPAKLADFFLNKTPILKKYPFKTRFLPGVTTVSSGDFSALLRLAIRAFYGLIFLQVFCDLIRA